MRNRWGLASAERSVAVTVGGRGRRCTALLASSALALLVTLASGCSTDDRKCTLIGWSEGLTVKLGSEAPLTAGTYRFVVEIPDETFDLDLDIVAPDSTEDGVVAQKELTRGQWKVAAWLSGSEQLGTDGAVTVGRFGNGSGGPESLTLTVQQDDTEIGRLELDEIDYQREEINGPGCGVATTASASLQLTPQ